MNDALNRKMMARAVTLARRGRFSTHPNPRVGCVIARGDEVVGEGWHERAGEAHAEVWALSQAGAQARGATAYVTLEPCSHFGRTPPCAKALIDAGVSVVYAAMLDPNPAVSGRGLALLREAGIQVFDGLLASEAQKLNPGFLNRMVHGRPWVRVKMAVSLDGRTAMASGESQWITGGAARRDVQRLRAVSDAILTGVGTVLSDDPSLTVRLEELGDIGRATTPNRQPLRVIADRDLRTPGQAKVLRGGPVHIFCALDNADSAAARKLREQGAEVTGISWNDRGVNLPEVLDALGNLGINELLVEAGPTLAGAFVEAQLADELWLYQAPVFLGSLGRPTVHLALEAMSQRIFWEVTDRRQLGSDQRLILRRTAGPL